MNQTIHDQLSDFGGESFWTYHGWTLTAMWIIGCTISILLKKKSVCLHAIGFFLVDVTTMIFVVGAWSRVYPHINEFKEWKILKKLHIIGGTLIALLILLQNTGGIIALFFQNKKNKFHRILGFVVVNLARVVMMLGWLLVEQKYIFLAVLIISILLFAGGFYKTFIEGQKNKKLKPQQQHINTKTKAS